MKLGSKRRLLQTVSFAVSNFGFVSILKTGFVCPFLYCYGCPFAAFGCPIGSLQNFVIMLQFPLFIVGSLGVYGMIFGRAFCGWACPFGTLHDMLSPTSRRGEIKARNYWYVKYLILFLTLAVAWLAADTVFCKFCPSGSLFASIPYPLHEYVLFGRFSSYDVYFYVHLFTLAAAIALALFVTRFWCRYLCPMGAIAGTFNKASAVNLKIDKDRCNECLACLDACVMGITKVQEIGSSTDCILCGRCVEACPQNALNFKIVK